MSEMTIPESRARLGYLLSEMLSLPNLPVDLNRMISDHLQKQLSLVNILKPEYCLRLYPVLAELAELSALESDNQPAASEVSSGVALSVATPESTPVESHSESVNGSTAEAVTDETPAELVNGPIHDQNDHFNLASNEQSSQEEGY
ncbi:MAG TPA: hypothetical protein VJ810_23190 [Blastocatellia bacterium]|nr:hypothetical protein [Blastocatellia bacterium]